MAIDTRSKRASVLGLVTGIALALPLADGTLSQRDRQHVAWSYSGILASAGVPADIGADVAVLCHAEDWVVETRVEDFVIEASEDTGVDA